MSRPLFVYGTLMDDELRGAVLGRATVGRAAVAPGFKTVFFPGRVYPALVQDKRANAVGLIIEGLSSDALSALDAYEGEEYHLGGIEVLCDGRTIAAQAYWAVVPVGPDSPAWSLQDWQRGHKAAQLAEIRAGRDESQAVART